MHSQSKKIKKSFKQSNNYNIYKQKFLFRTGQRIKNKSRLKNMNPKLKPLAHKQLPNTVIVPKPLNNKNVLGKPNEKPVQQPLLLNKKTSNGQQKPPKANQQAPRQIKTPMKMMRTSTKKIQFYDDCEDDFEIEVEDNIKYFEGQLQKNIKQQPFPNAKKQQPQNKALIVLPKLESQLKVKGAKDLQKQMDLQMSRMMQRDNDDHYY